MMKRKTRIPTALLLCALSLELGMMPALPALAAPSVLLAQRPYTEADGGQNALAAAGAAGQNSAGAAQGGGNLPGTASAGQLRVLEVEILQPAQVMIVDKNGKIIRKASKGSAAAQPGGGGSVAPGSLSQGSGSAPGGQSQGGNAPAGLSQSGSVPGSLSQGGSAPGGLPGQPGTQQPTLPTAVESLDVNRDKLSLASEAAILMDADTGKILYAKNGYVRMEPASTTKLMTALLSLEHLSPGKAIAYSKTAVEGLESGASSLKLKAGDRLSLDDSLYALMLRSACDVANGLGEAVSGSEAAFAQLMTRRAAALGCKDTQFKNASGLHADGHWTTVYDMALITREAMKNAKLRKIVGTQSYQVKELSGRFSTTVKNGNRLINPKYQVYDSRVLGGKTGYTSKAGNTLATMAKSGGKTLICVVMKSKGEQFNDTAKLYRYGFQQ